MSRISYELDSKQHTRFCRQKVLCQRRQWSCTSVFKYLTLQTIIKWFRVTFKKIVNSIAFLPGVIAILFLLLSFGMISFDFSDAGKQLKSNLHWLSLKDASTARSICSAIAGGIISLAVFSFSMVMILLNQAASQMSNRILAKLIGNRFQQIVLGFYIGTIVYALFLLSTIRDINSGIYVPAMSTYLLIALTIFDIFLFIYFLHYVTETVKYETIINDIYQNTLKELEESCVQETQPPKIMQALAAEDIGAFRSGLYQGFDRKELLAFCDKHDLGISFLFPIGTFLLENTAFMNVSGSKAGLTKELLKDISTLINIGRGQEISTSYYYGMRQLMEISIRALSPGINDPGTAVLGLHTLGDLMAVRLKRSPQLTFKDSRNVERIWVKEKSFEEVFEEYIFPIWDYGKDDRLIQKEMLLILTQLNALSSQPVFVKLLKQVDQSIK